jgi:hypothetical protein
LYPAIKNRIPVIIDKKVFDGIGILETAAFIKTDGIIGGIAGSYQHKGILVLVPFEDIIHKLPAIVRQG